MWENEQRKFIIRNCIVGFLLVVLAAGLFIGMRKVNREMAQKNAMLTVQKTDQVQKITEERANVFEEIAAGYQKDMDTVAEYLPGIVCWGDSLTTGAASGVSYPDTLQNYINDYICKAYDFRSTVENAVENSRIKWEDYTVEIPVVNMGGGQENTATVRGRSGVLPFKIKNAFTVPESCEPVDIALESVDYQSVTPLSAGSSGINPVTIEGVEGTLSLVGTNPKSGKYQFTRMEPGQSVAVPAGAEVSTAVGQEYKNYIHIVWVGTFDNFRSNENLVSQVRSILERQTQNTDRYLVLGVCSLNQSWISSNASRLDSLDSAMMQAFGNHYVNVRKYLVEDGLKDAGMPADEKASNVVPAALRSNSGTAELSSTAYELVGRLVYERMNRLGYFDEIRQELKIPADYEPKK